MPNTIDTVEDDSQVSSVLESDASELLKTRQLKSRFPAPRRKPLPRWVFAGLGLAFAAMAGFSWWLHARHFESTDDAQIDGHINVFPAESAVPFCMSIRESKTTSTSRPEPF